tara:strand:+ start:40484 stop:40876 length:393 start_codon:yes stop_codon:yes gene_type:complete
MKKLETRTIHFLGEDREYDVVSKDLDQPAPRWFIGYNNGRPFISDEVRRDYQRPMVFHELAEFEILQSENGSCLEALKAELMSIPVNERRAYVRFRKEVFRELVEYFEKNEPKSQLIPQVKKSLAHLEKL